jgi:predicted lipoprotein with Yx(FWY)xxD motif
MRISVPLILCVCLSTLAACQREAAAPETASTPPATQPAATPPTTAPVPAATTGSVPEAALTLVTAGVPHPLVADASNKTVYFVEGDMDGSKCTGACRETWPPVLVDTGTPGLSSALTGTVATVDRADGGRQLTYNGHPLYRYAGDTGAGRNAGHGVQDKWGHWSAMAADGSALPQAATPTAQEKSPAPPTAEETPKPGY